MTEVEAQETSDDIPPITVLKLLLFLVWWFSGIGVGTAFISPGAIGPVISPNLLLVIILSFFSSALLIVALIPEPTSNGDVAQSSNEETEHGGHA